MSQSDLINKIKKLITVSDPKNGATSGEIENAISLMEKLMRDNNISMTDVSFHGDNVDLTKAMSEKWEENNAWQKILAKAVSELCECDAMICSSALGIKFVFIGTKHDTELALEFYSAIKEKIISAMKAPSLKFYIPEADLKSYAEGYVFALQKRIHEIKTRVDERAMIFVGKKALAIKRVVEALAQSAEKVQMESEVNEAFMIGAQHGEKLDLDFKKDKPQQAPEAKKDTPDFFGSVRAIDEIIEETNL